MDLITRFTLKGVIDDGRGRIFVDDIELCPAESRAFGNDSPDGFSWGHGGSGPSQTALVICLHIFKNHRIAQALYENFKFQYIGNRPVHADFEELIDITDFLIDNRERFSRAAEKAADF